MKKYNVRIFAFLIFLACLLPNAGMCQQYSISGYVKDAQSGDILINAALFNGNLGTLTNEYGFFSLSLTRGKHQVEVSYVGYKPVALDLNLQQDTMFTVMLEASSEIGEIEVYGQAQKLIQRTSNNHYTLSSKEIAKLPVMLGEADVIKAIQLLPGVQACNEASGGLMVRGGGTDGNLIILDDVPIFNVSHVWGLFSVFDPNVIKSVQFYNGSFPAKFGGRSSSVLDLRLKDGNKYEYHGDVSVGLVASKILLEGPLVKEKASFLFSVRRTYLDLPLTLFQKIKHPDYNNYSKGFYFYDIIGKISIDLGQNDRLYFSVYTGSDKTYLNEEKDTTSRSNASLKWGNFTSAMRWNRQWTHKLYSNITATNTRYYYGVAQENLKSDTLSYALTESDYRSQIHNYGLKLDANYYAANEVKFDFGAFISMNEYNTGESSYYAQQGRGVADGTTSEYQAPIYETTEYGGYLSARLSFFKLLYPTLGVRYVNYRVVNDVAFQFFEPRFNLVIKHEMLPVSISGAYSKMHQPLHLLSSSGISLPVDLWVPATAEHMPVEADQYSLGVDFAGDKHFNASISGYWKTLINTVDYKVGESFSPANLNWEEKIAVGEGRSKGIELMLELSDNRLTGNIAYTLSGTESRSDMINNGEWYPSTYDHRHELKINGNYELKKNVNINAVWVFGTGGAVTIPESRYFLAGDNRVIDFYDYSYFSYSERNNYRMPAYHRLDVGVNITKSKKRGVQTFSYGIYNLYNRKNPYYLTNRNQRNPNEFYTNSLLPILPYVTYRFQF